MKARTDRDIGGGWKTGMTSPVQKNHIHFPVKEEWTWRSRKV